MKLAQSIFKLANSEHYWEDFLKVSSLPESFKPRYQFWINHFVREWVLIKMIQGGAQQGELISFNSAIHGMCDSLHTMVKLNFLAEDEFIDNLKNFLTVQLRNADEVGGGVKLPLGQWIIMSSGYMGFCFDGYKQSKRQGQLELHNKVYSAFFLKLMFGSFVYDLVGKDSIPKIYELLEKITKEADDLLVMK